MKGGCQLFITLRIALRVLGPTAHFFFLMLKERSSSQHRYCTPKVDLDGLRTVVQDYNKLNF